MFLTLQAVKRKEPSVASRSSNPIQNLRQELAAAYRVSWCVMFPTYQIDICNVKLATYNSYAYHSKGSQHRNLSDKPIWNAF